MTKIFVDTRANFHPYECGGPPANCPHCMRRKTDDHDPDTCDLCDPGYDGMPPSSGRKIVSLPVGVTEGSLGQREERSGEAADEADPLVALSEPRGKPAYAAQPVGRHDYVYGGFEVQGDCGYCGHVQDDPIHEPPFCPFCNYSGPSDILASYMGGDVFVIVPINPVTPGHVLVIPRWHIEDFTDGFDYDMSPVMTGARWWARDHEGDWNLITSKGEAATQSVKHLHVHLVPRRKDDRLLLPWSTWPLS